MFEIFNEIEKLKILSLISEGVAFEHLDYKKHQLKISVPENSPNYETPKALAKTVADIFNQNGFSVLYRIRKDETWDNELRERAVSDTNDILNL